MAKLTYLKRCLAVQFQSARFRCPNCGGSKNRQVDSKLLITQLRRCEDCELLFRTPTDDPALNAQFYEEDYSQGFTSDTPSDTALAQLKQSNFAGTEKDYSYYIDVLSQLGLRPGDKLFDYGCSWGYGSYQLGKAGFDVTSFEVARTRSRYAEEKLQVRVVQDMERATQSLAGQFDCFFSAHVIEHVPSPERTFEFASRLLKANGLFVSFTPNGSEGYRSKSDHWKKLWGEVHPNLIDDVFLDHSFSQVPRCIGSSPISGASVGNNAQLKRLNELGTEELFFAARKTGQAWH
jgi:SAM-dependent methyltransferase